MGKIEMRCQRRKLAVRHFATYKATRQCDRIDNSIRQRVIPMTLKRCVQKANIETSIVCDQYRALYKIEKHLEHVFNARRISNHGRRDSSQHHNVRWNWLTRVYQGAETRYFLAPSVLNGPNFRDATNRA